MKNLYKTDDWMIIQEGFSPESQRESESIFSIANGRIGQRGNFEEDYSEDHLLGSYIAGIHYKDPTKVGWWKIGYPKYYARTPNAPDWSKIKVRLIDEELNLAEWDVQSFQRILHLKNGLSERNFTATSPKGHTIHAHIEHFVHMKQQDLCLIHYQIRSENYTGKISFLPYIEGNVQHEEANYNQKMWDILQAETTSSYAFLKAQVLRENSQVCIAFSHRLYKNGKECQHPSIRIEKEKSVGFSSGAEVAPGDTLDIYKYIAVTSTLYYESEELINIAIKECTEAQELGWENSLNIHSRVWNKLWANMDTVIEGDSKAQQAIRYNIFQLNQTYRGNDPRLNIAPKGFTGEKYGGNTQWNTELCCVPFFLLSTPEQVVQNLLLYRYNQLPKAIENATRLGYTHGAALFPMSTTDGKECHNEWEITFEEIHRNNIIVHAIYFYIEYNGKWDYMAKYGLEVCIAICRFWAQRVSFCNRRNKYVILGVTGPNEYEVNVNNNWYTNYGCSICLKHTCQYLQKIAELYPKEYEEVIIKTTLCAEEPELWQKIADNMYIPEDKELGIFLQQDDFLDKEIRTVDTLSPEERPLNQHWAWDRILRSCFIKQADVLLGCSLFKNHFSSKVLQRNFDFYEPLTLHESSLSPFIHGILAAEIGYTQKAYELFMQSVRLDLDDYNNDVKEGLHITSMAGSWLVLSIGFAGIKTDNQTLSMAPSIPQEWKSYSFHVNYYDNTLLLTITQQTISIENQNGKTISIKVYNRNYEIAENSKIEVTIKQK